MRKGKKKHLKNSRRVDIYRLYFSRTVFINRVIKMKRKKGRKITTCTQALTHRNSYSSKLRIENCTREHFKLHDAKKREKEK